MTTTKDFNLRIIIYGFTCILTQTLFLREIIANISSNEIFLIFFLSVWILSTAFGIWLGKNSLSNIKKEIYTDTFHIISSPIIIFSLVLIRKIKLTFSPIGENLPMFLSSSTILISTILYTLPSGIYIAISSQDDAKKTPLVYLFDCIGYIIGGIFLYLALAFFETTYIIILISIINIFAIRQKIFRKGYLALYLSSFILIFFLLNIYTNITTKNKKLISSINTHYGRIDIYEYLSSKYIYYNSSLISSDDYSDAERRKSTIVKIFTPNAKNVAYIGYNLKFLSELSSTIKVSADLIETDRRLFDIQKKILNLNNLSFNTINEKPLKYFKQTKKIYDAIIFDISLPLDISKALLFEERFFKDVKKNINKNGAIIYFIASEKNPNIYSRNAIEDIIKRIYQNFKTTKVFYDDFYVIVGFQKELTIIPIDKYTKEYYEYLTLRQITNISLNTKEKNLSIYTYSFLGDTLRYFTKISFIVEIISKKVGVFVIILILLILSFKTSNASNMIISSFSFISIEMLSITLWQIKYGGVYLDIVVITSLAMCGLVLGIFFAEKFKIKKPMIFYIITTVLLYLIPTKPIMIFSTFVSGITNGYIFKNISEKIMVKTYIYESIGIFLATIFISFWLVSFENLILLLLIPLTLNIITILKKI